MLMQRPEATQRACPSCALGDSLAAHSRRAVRCCAVAARLVQDPNASAPRSPGASSAPRVVVAIDPSAARHAINIPVGVLLITITIRSPTDDLILVKPLL